MIGKLLLILLIFGVLAGVDLQIIFKSKRWREMAVYCVFLLLGLTVALLHQIFKFDFSVFTRWLITATSNG